MIFNLVSKTVKSSVRMVSFNKKTRSRRNIDASSVHPGVRHFITRLLYTQIITQAAYRKLRLIYTNLVSQG